MARARGRSAALGYGAYRPRGDRPSWAATASQAPADEQCGEHHVADRRELPEVPRRVEAEPEPRRERAHERAAARESRRERRELDRSRPFRICGSQIHACREGRTKMTANGFSATMRNESTASASSAATWPDSSSSRRRPSRHEPIAREEPAERQEAAVHDQPDTGHSRSGRQLRRKRPSRPVAPRSEEREELEQQHGEEPEQQPAAVAPQRRRERNVSPAAVREQVDDTASDGQHGGDEHELDRPAADDAPAEVDVARRPFRELDVLVERPEQRLAASARSGRAVRCPGDQACRRTQAAGGRRRGERDGRDARARRTAPARTG